MIHDCAITESYLVVFVCPVVVVPEGPGRGELALRWRPERRTRIAVIARDGSGIRWFEQHTVWVWHVINAFEHHSQDGTTITIDYPFWAHPGIRSPGVICRGGIARTVLDLELGLANMEQVDDRMAEFSRLDDRLVGRRHRYFYVIGKDRRSVGPWDQDLPLRHPHGSDHGAQNRDGHVG